MNMSLNSLDIGQSRYLNSSHDPLYFAYFSASLCCIEMSLNMKHAEECPLWDISQPSKMFIAKEIKAILD